MSKIDDVAKAILASHVDSEDWARAAIEAMREPTESMLIAALHDYMGYEKQGPRKAPWNGRTMWRAMIDAALKE